MCNLMIPDTLRSLPLTMDEFDAIDTNVAPYLGHQPTR